MRQKIFRLFADLRFSIFTLLLISGCSIIGTVIEQDQSIETYKINYPITNPVFGFLSWDKIIYFEEIMIKKVDKIYSTKYQTADDFLKMLNLSLKELDKSDDPLILFAKEVFDESLEFEKEFEEMGAKRQLLKSKFISLLKEYYKSLDKQMYADANGTLRVTYGNVAGVSLKDGLTYEPFTRLEGISQKHTGVSPFNASDKLLNLVDNKDYGRYLYKPINSVPVNFLSTLDITNGNSGSATINSKFELVGLAFDGMLETIIADYKHIPEARTISVDSRYLLWTLEKLEKADNILEELTIVN